MDNQNIKIKAAAQSFYTLARRGRVNDVINSLNEIKKESPELVTQILNCYVGNYDNCTILHAATFEILDRLWEYNPPRLVFKSLFELIKLGADENAYTLGDCNMTVKKYLNQADWSVLEEYDFQHQEFFLGGIFY
jgi:hypothetical protein